MAVLNTVNRVLRKIVRRNPPLYCTLTLIAVQRHYFKADIKKTLNLGIVQFCYVGSIVGLVSTLQGVQIHLKGADESTIMFMVFAEVTMSL